MGNYWNPEPESQREAKRNMACFTLETEITAHRRASLQPGLSKDARRRYKGLIRDLEETLLNLKTMDAVITISNASQILKNNSNILAKKTGKSTTNEDVRRLIFDNKAEGKTFRIMDGSDDEEEETYEHRRVRSSKVVDEDEQKSYRDRSDRSARANRDNRDERANRDNRNDDRSTERSEKPMEQKRTKTWTSSSSSAASTLSTLSARNSSNTLELANDNSLAVNDEEQALVE
jgi:hypothetical protein